MPASVALTQGRRWTSSVGLLRCPDSRGRGAPGAGPGPRAKAERRQRRGEGGGIRATAFRARPSFEILASLRILESRRAATAPRRRCSISPLRPKPRSAPRRGTAARAQWATWPPEAFFLFQISPAASMERAAAEPSPADLLDMSRPSPGALFQNAWDAGTAAAVAPARAPPRLWPTSSTHCRGEAPCGKHLACWSSIVSHRITLAQLLALRSTASHDKVAWTASDTAARDRKNI